LRLGRAVAYFDVDRPKACCLNLKDLHPEFMDWVLVALTGFFGSMHCVGMCGTIVAAYSTQDAMQVSPASGRWHMISRHLSYNAGRVLSYIIVGTVLGAVGGSFGGLKTVGTWFSTIIGGILILAGIWMLRLFPWLSFPQQLSLTSDKKSILFSFYTRTYGTLLQSPTIESKFYIGMITPLLPCGLLYSAFIVAAASGSAVNGAISMGLFGAGIVPALVVVGLVSVFFRLRLRAWGDKLAAATIILMGLMMLFRGLGLPIPWMGMWGMHHHH
jgi:sulfite exporter TauE/SafE